MQYGVFNTLLLFNIYSKLYLNVEAARISVNHKSIKQIAVLQLYGGCMHPKFNLALKLCYACIYPVHT